MTAQIIAVARLRHRLTIEAPLSQEDDAGGRALNYIVVAGTWGGVIPTSGREKIVAERTSAEITHRVRIRYRENIKAGMRLRHGARILNIHGAFDPFGDKRWLICLTQEEQ